MNLGVGLWLAQCIVLCAQKEKPNGVTVEYSAAIVNVTLSCLLRKDNVNKHLGSEMQQRALSFDKSLPRHPGELRCANREQNYRC